MGAARASSVASRCRPTAIRARCRSTSVGSIACSRSIARRDAHWNADGKQGDDLEYEIELFEVADQTAAAKLSAKWGIDYMHLAKFDGEWKIMHVMWQSHPPQARDE